MPILYLKNSQGEPEPIPVMIGPRGERGEPGEGVPDGGTDGQIIVKSGVSAVWQDQNTVDGIAAIDGNIPLSAARQYSTMPTVTTADNGTIAQYIGTDETTYKTGHWYEVVNGAWVEIVYGDPNSVSYDTQTGKTDAQKTQARTNIGASASNHTHGNITNDGKIGDAVNLPIFTGTNGILVTKTAVDARMAIGAETRYLIHMDSLPTASADYIDYVIDVGGLFYKIYEDEGVYSWVDYTTVEQSAVQWYSAYTPSAGTYSLARYGRFIHIYGSAVWGTTVPTQKNVGTVPSGFLPVESTQIPINASGAYSNELNLNSAGVIRSQGVAIPAGSFFVMNAWYLAAN